MTCQVQELPFAFPRALWMDAIESISRHRPETQRNDAIVCVNTDTPCGFTRGFISWRDVWISQPSTVWASGQKAKGEMDWGPSQLPAVRFLSL